MQRPFPQRNWSAVHIEVAAGCIIYSVILKSLELISSCFSAKQITHVCSQQILHMTGWLSEERSSYSLQFFSSDWSSQSNSPSHLQPALMHMPLLHMNSTDLQGWWEAAHTEQHQKHVTAGTTALVSLCFCWFGWTTWVLYPFVETHFISSSGIFLHRLIEIKVQMWVLNLILVSSTE